MSDELTRGEYLRAMFFSSAEEFAMTKKPMARALEEIGALYERRAAATGAPYLTGEVRGERVVLFPVPEAERGENKLAWRIYRDVRRVTGGADPEKVAGGD